jgi:hypothetical protein
MDHSIVNSGFQWLPGLIAAWKAPSGHDEARQVVFSFSWRLLSRVTEHLS